MTRIDIPLASPPTEGPLDKTVGKVAQKDDDSRHASFRSLMKQLSGNGNTTDETTGKPSSKGEENTSVRQHPILRRSDTDKNEPRVATPDDESAPAAQQPTVSTEPAMAWQAILGSSAADQTKSPSAPLKLSVQSTARTQETETAPVSPQENAKRNSADRLGKSVASLALPTTPGLELTHQSLAQPASDEASDPVASLTSLFDRTAELSDEVGTVEAAHIKMSVVTRETHFEPVARLSPVQQIATAVGEEFLANTEQPQTEAISRTSEQSHHTSGPLKVLHVKLEPEDLGTVVLKMRLVDKSLELEVIASRQETADLLTKDRDLLTRALRGSGYTADIVTISASTAPDTSAQTGDNRAGGQSSAGQPGAQPGSDRNSGGSTGSGDRTQARQPQVEGGTHEDNGAGRSGGDLYL